MHKIFRGISIIMILLSILNNGISQTKNTTVIDYSKFSSSDCNVFRTGTQKNAPANVTATYNKTTTTTIAHFTTCGQVVLNNKLVDLECSTNANDGSNSGTEYSIDFNFVKGNSYIVTFNVSSFYYNNIPKIRADFISAATTGGEGSGQTHLNYTTIC